MTLGALNTLPHFFATLLNTLILSMGNGAGETLSFLFLICRVVATR